MSNPYSNPWEAPSAKPANPWGEFDPGHRPTVVIWFWVYCGFMALMYFGISLLGGIMMFVPAGPNDTPEEMIGVRIMGGILAAVCLLFGGVFGVAPFLPRRPWVWVYDIVLICLGLTGCPTLLASIPLLIFWLKPDAKVYFGKSPN